MPKGPTTELCEFVVDTKLGDIPREVVERAKHVLLDGIACGLFGARLEWSERAVRALQDIDGVGGASTVWGWNHKLTPMSAALLNGTFIQAYELDDVHHRGCLHSAASTVPAVMATAETLGGVDGRAFIEAIIFGFEVGIRVGEAMGSLDLLRRGWHTGSIYGPLGSAAGCGKLRGLDHRQMEDAVSLAATQACGLMSAQFGSMVKRMHHGIASRSGVLAAALASRGFTGIDDVIEREYGGLITTHCNGSAPIELLTAGLGQKWEVMELAPKPPYASMGALHPGIEAALDIRSRPSFRLDRIESVELGVGDEIFHHGGWKMERPTTETGAQMNNAYAAAVAFIDGSVSIPQWTKERANRDDIWELLPKFTVYNDKGLNDLGEEGRWATRLKVTYVGGDSESAVVYHSLGDRARLLSNSDIAQKFSTIAEMAIEHDRAEQIKDIVLNIEDCQDIGVLSNLLNEEAVSPFDSLP